VLPEEYSEFGDARGRSTRHWELNLLELTPKRPHFDEIVDFVEQSDEDNDCEP
jgi:hypothetical protein